LEVIVGVSKKILIVEDQENILELVSAIFNDLKDYKILQARDGKEAISMASEHNPDIVLLDIQLPKINGYDVCTLIKKNPSLSHTKVLMLSSQGQKYDIKKSEEVGANGYIVKPFRPTKLVEKVEELLEKD
jgi:DNA-binding response OmpR family regulator